MPNIKIVKTTKRKILLLKIDEFVYKMVTMLIEAKGGDSSKMHSHFLRAWVISRKNFKVLREKRET
ncbi:hypothetical protein DZB84_11955 [Bacillus sp. HNG]|nr:hypothetical protein DZB84_11955 [Bacillus sp. HNG]